MKMLIKKIDAEIVSYLFFGVLTTVVSMAVYYIGIYVDFNLQLTNLASNITGIVFAYITNKIWVFNKRNFEFKYLLAEFSKFFLSRLFTLIFDMLFLSLLVDVFHFHKLISKVVTLIIVVILNYFFSKKKVFV